MTVKVTPLPLATSYRAAGVDIARAASLIDRIKPLTKATSRPGSVGEIGGFGGLFDLKAAGFTDPILVSGTDGVGTKLRIASAAGEHRFIGLDLVAMCVNDLVVQGAEPLFFLDYFATSILDPKQAEIIIAGIAKGCIEAHCALIGGEIAEMPDHYPKGEYDLAGFAVGAVERDQLIDGRTVQAGDIILGLPANGVHANGFSLIRHIIAMRGLNLLAQSPFDSSCSLAESLLLPTRFYVTAARTAVATGQVRAMAHITGGGLTENIPRILPNGLGARLFPASWKPLPVFAWLARNGPVAAYEMLRSFNCGIGYVLICAPDAVTKITTALSDWEILTLGAVEAGVDGVLYDEKNLEQWIQTA